MEITVGGLPLQLLFELFGYSIAAALVAGLVAPLVGSFLLVRRTGFYGIALPQFAAAGIAFGFAVLPLWIELLGDFYHPTELGDSAHLALGYHLQWAGLFTALGLGVMTWATRKKDGTESGVLAASFAAASAATILFSGASAEGDIFITNLLRGEILTIDFHEFEILAISLALVAGLLLYFRAQLVRASYDPVLTRVMGKRPVVWEALLMLLIGITVSASVMTIGPVVLFGLLVIPPLAVRGFAKSMDQLLLYSSLAGLVSAAGGVWTSFQFDWPLGPSLVVVAALLLIPRALGMGRA